MGQVYAIKVGDRTVGHSMAGSAAQALEAVRPHITAVEEASGFHWYYTPYNPGATMGTDANTPNGGGGPRFVPAGRLQAVRPGAKPHENRKDIMNGRYAKRVSRKEAEHSFGKRIVGDIAYDAY